MIRRFDKSDWSRAFGELRRSLTGLFISLLLHAAVLLVLGLLVFSIPNDSIPPIELGWTTVVDNDNQSPTPIAQETIEIPTVSISDNNTASKEMAAATSTEPKTPVEDPEPKEDAKPEVRLGDVSQALSLRNDANKDSAGDSASAGAKKGTGREAIEDALTWIARQQGDDGSWDLTGPYPDGARFTTQTKTGATALALLALLGDGNTPQSGPYKEEVRRGIEWLVEKQKPSGDLFDMFEQGREPHFYAHSQATIALCEALVLTGDEWLRPPAEKAVRFLVEAQNPELGGWKYRPLGPDGIGDLSVTGWVLMALHSARMAGIEIPFDTFLLADRFLTSVQENPADPSHYKYRPDFPVTDGQRLSMTAEGLLCRQWLGWPKHTPALRRGINFLISEKYEPEWLPGRRNVYAWYYTAQTLHNYGGKDWTNWFGEVLPLIVKHQQRAGKNRGSWHPTKPLGSPHERAQDAGRLYLTAMCVLILETPYRHRPLYESQEQASTQ